MNMRALGLVVLLSAPALALAQLSPPPPPPRPPSELTPPPPPPRPATSTSTATATPTPTATPTATSTSTSTATSTTTAAKLPLSTSTPADDGNGGGRSDGPPLLGLMVDGGFPDGIGASVLVRPIWFARFQAGATYNLLGPGIRAGVTLVPFHFPIVPTASFEYGHAFQADAGRLAGLFGKLSATEKTLLKKVGYDYLSLQAGLETGSQTGFAWFVRAGVSWVWTRARNFQEAVQPTVPAGVTVTSTDPKIRVLTPSINTGFNLYF
jgi:hypothetical protein